MLYACVDLLFLALNFHFSYYMQQLPVFCLWLSSKFTVCETTDYGGKQLHNAPISACAGYRCNSSETNTTTFFSRSSIFQDNEATPQPPNPHINKRLFRWDYLQSSKNAVLHTCFKVIILTIIRKYTLCFF